MAAKKPAKKRIKDLKPSKRTAQKVKGGSAATLGPVDKLKDQINRRVPDPY